MSSVIISERTAGNFFSAFPIFPMVIKDYIYKHFKTIILTKLYHMKKCSKK